MAKYHQRSLESDLDDDDETDQRNEYTLPQLSFDEKLTAHRSNRLNETFGQINFSLPSHKVIKSNDELLVPLPRITLSTQGRRQIYEASCQMLDITMDWQLRALLPYDTITIINRSFSFNDIRAFATAIEANLESLILSSVGLTSRSINVLCQGLSKCIHLNLLDLSNNKIDKHALKILINRITDLSSLRCLSLANCGIRDSYGRCIGDLCRHQTLMEINLNGNEFEEMACIFFGNALSIDDHHRDCSLIKHTWMFRLAENESLICFNLSWNLIRSFASIALFRGFEMNTTLTDFDISWSNLGYDGSVALRRVLAVNKVLQRLNISNCNIDWTCTKLIGEGLQKNSILKILNLSFNPLTTHGVQDVVQGLSNQSSVLSMLDLSGLAVFSGTVRLAEKIASERHFIMKYDFETHVHDVIGRQKVTKADSVRKIIQHIDEKHWRPLDYFRVLNNQRKVQAQNETLSYNTSKSDHNKKEHHRQSLPNPLVEPLTLKNLNDVINRQRMRDRLQKARQEQQEQDLKKRNQKILQTVNQHFPDIDVISRKQKHQTTIEQLTKPRMSKEKNNI